MSRWLHDGFFLRVVCLVLVLITLTFTLILTNVFVDIDGIMTKQKDKQSNTILVKTVVHTTDRHASGGQDGDAGVLKTRVEQDIFRTKRSLVPTKVRDSAAKNKKMRDALTNRLVSLLEELDGGDEPTTTEGQASTATRQTATVTPPIEKPPKEDYRHLALHNILLKGIVDHADVNLVYRRVRDMIAKIVSVEGNSTVTEKKACKTNTYNSVENPEEDNIIEEMLNCKHLNQEVAGRELRKHNSGNKTIEKKAPQLLIKTIIDISNTGSDNLKNSTHATNRENENIKGIVNLLYNGRRVKFSQDSDEIRNVTPSPKPKATTREPLPYKPPNKLTDDEAADKRNKMLSKMMYGYYKHFQIPPNDVPVFSDILNNDQEKVEKEPRRPKRNVKVSHTPANMFNTNEHEKGKKTNKMPDKHDDDLYVEIETHFDDKGMIGERKKKLIQNLIEKIENAINTNLNTSTENKADTKNSIKKILKIRKRLQNSLDHENKQNSTSSMNKVRSLPETILERHINSINPANDPAIDVYDKQKQIHHTPALFNDAKATNSAENIKFYMRSHPDDIPQRLQDPLMLPDTNIYDVDVGDLKFVIKDIVGTGFVIGFSQYVDDIPDPDNIKLFSNIEELFRTYHQNYDDDSAAEVDDNEQNYTEIPAEHNISKRNAIFDNQELHNINDPHRNEYKLIFSKNHFFPFNSYREIMHKTDKAVETNRQNDINDILTNRNPNVNSTMFQNIILNKILKPSEIFTLANLMNIKRKKRSVNYKKVSQVRPKTVRRKINKYIKSKSTPVTKVIYRKPVRNKREARDKIRLIARDVDFPQDSNEDVVLFSDDESVLADRAIIKDSDMSTMRREMGDHQPEYVPYYDSRFHPDHVLRKFFDRVRTTHNRMMSKYPHLFVEEVSKSKELQDKSVYEEEPVHERFNEHEPEMYFAHQEPHLQHGVLDLYPNMPQPEPNSNFKVTVKIMPKNSSDDTSGFREVHTSINKTFNKDGLAYVSLVNISEISKVEKVNTTCDYDCLHSTNHQSATKEDRVKHLLKQKKDKITAQLKKLEREKDTIEMMISHTTSKPATNSKSADLLSLVNGKLLDMNREALANLLTDALKAKVQTMATTTAANVAAVTPKKQIISPVTKTARNQGSKDQALLVKLDKNTEVLEKILKTISLRSDQPPIQYVIHKDEKRDTKTTVAPINYDSSPPATAQNNSYNIRVPYMYGNAYQSQMAANRSPIASVIYQGTVYTPEKATNKVNKQATLRTPGRGIESKNQINAEMINNDTNNMNSIMLLNSISPLKMNRAKNDYQSIKYNKFSPVANNTGVFN